jgi:hypothetical protein
LIKQIIASDVSQEYDDESFLELSPDETLRERLSKQLRRLAREVVGGVDSPYCLLSRVVGLVSA